MVIREEAPILQYYKRLRNSRNVSDIDLPLSGIWYVRAAIESRYGEFYTVEHVQISAWLEGLIDPGAVTKIPEWYKLKYMGGQEMDFKGLKAEVTEKFNRRVKRLKEEQEVADESILNFLVD